MKRRISSSVLAGCHLCWDVEKHYFSRVLVPATLSWQTDVPILLECASMCLYRWSCWNHISNLPMQRTAKDNNLICSLLPCVALCWDNAKHFLSCHGNPVLESTSMCLYQWCKFQCKCRTLQRTTTNICSLCWDNAKLFLNLIFLSWQPSAGICLYVPISVMQIPTQMQRTAKDNNLICVEITQSTSSILFSCPGNPWCHPSMNRIS